MTFDKAMIHTLERKIDELEIEIGRLRAIGENQPKWIPVSERLPDMGKYVLCSVDKNHVYESDLEVIITQFRNEGWWTDGRIKAWMPLPKPYKEGE